MNNINITIITALATSVLSYFILNYKNNEKENDAREKEYLDIIIEFFKIKKFNKDFSVIEYLEDYKYKTKAIPPYVFYAISEMKYDEGIIQKILENDYFERIGTGDNFLIKTMKKLYTLICYIISIAIIIGTGLGEYMLCEFTNISLKDDIEKVGVKLIVLLCLTAILMIIALVLLLIGVKVFSYFNDYQVHVNSIKSKLNEKIKNTNADKIKIRRIRDFKKKYFVLL